MITLFVSDIHLHENRPKISAGFFNFLRNKAVSANALFILGDLFDGWIGDDYTSETISQTIHELQKLNQCGVKLYFQHGNRDFLIGRKFSSETGMEILPEYHVIDLCGHQVLLCHGDSLCTDDVRYMSYRRKVRNRFSQFLFRQLPIKTRQRITNSLLKTSSSAKQEKPMEIMDVNQNAVQQIMCKHQTDTMIHGHTHRPADHRFTSDTKSAQQRRLVLGDWETHAWWIEADSSGLRLLSEPF